MAVMSAIIAASITVNRASMENSRKMISTPKNTPVIGALKVAAMPPPAPQATRIRSRFSGIFTHWPRLEASAEPICTIGPSRPTDPPDPDAQRRGDRLDHADLRPDPPAIVRDGDHHLGHAVPAGLPREPVDQRAVQQPADDRDDHEEAHAQPGQVRAGRVALLAELAVPGSRPGEEVDQVPEHDRAQPGPGPHQQREQEQPAAARPQPPGRPPGPSLRRAGHGRRSGTLPHKTMFAYCNYKFPPMRDSPGCSGGRVCRSGRRSAGQQPAGRPALTGAPLPAGQLNAAGGE